MPPDRPVDSNGVKDPRVRELASCAELVHGVSAYAKDGRNFFDGQQRLEAGHRAPVRIVQHFHEEAAPGQVEAAGAGR